MTLIPEDHGRSQVNLDFMIPCLGSHCLPEVSPPPPYPSPELTFSPKSEIKKTFRTRLLWSLKHWLVGGHSPDVCRALLPPLQWGESSVPLTCSPGHHTFFLPDTFVKIVRDFVLISQIKSCHLVPHCKIFVNYERYVLIVLCHIIWVPYTQCLI